jgi:hypothetical protein
VSDLKVEGDVDPSVTSKSPPIYKGQEAGLCRIEADALAVRQATGPPPWSPSTAGPIDDDASLP